MRSPYRTPSLPSVENKPMTITLSAADLEEAITDWLRKRNLDAENVRKFKLTWSLSSQGAWELETHGNFDLNVLLEIHATEVTK